MSLTLYFHPLSSFCQKVLIALYENDTPFTPHLVDLADAEAAAAFRRLWPIGKFPVLRDDARGLTVPESTPIIDHLALHFAGAIRLQPQDAEAALKVRALDRFCDLYLNTPMQKIVTDRLRPAGQHDAFGVEQARAQLRTAYGILEAELDGRRWVAGDDFSMADCAAAPALFYAAMTEPLERYPRLGAYLQRLCERPSFARVLREAQPYLQLMPKS